MTKTTKPKTVIVSWNKWRTPRGYVSLRDEPSRQRTIFIRKDKAPKNHWSRRK